MTRIRSGYVLLLIYAPASSCGCVQCPWAASFHIAYELLLRTCAAFAYPVWCDKLLAPWPPQRRAARPRSWVAWMLVAAARSSTLALRRSCRWVVADIWSAG